MLDIKKIETAISQISSEKKIPKETLIEIIESAIKTAYKRDHGSKDENVKVHLNLETGSVEISVVKTVVEEVENEALEISLEDAEGYDVGDVVEIDMTDEVFEKGFEESFGRRASQAAEQVIIQKIGESEKQKIYDLFKDRVGEILSMKVVMVESGKVILDFNGDQVVLPKSEQVSRDTYIPDSRVYIYVAEAYIDEKNGPRVVLSRKNKAIVGEIFKLFAPELTDGTIMIEKIERYPGIKSKILVSTHESEVDPAGSLIGQKGMRVKSVMEELSGEKIDIVVNNENIPNMIARALSPAEVLRVDIDEENKKALVLLLPTQRAKAIGKNGVNINLASKLLGYEISLEEIQEEQ